MKNTMGYSQSVFLFLLVNLVVIHCQNVEEKFFDQLLDHVQPNTATWKQRYFENKQFYREGGPVFIVLGGPRYSPTIPQTLTHGSVPAYAKEQGANLVALEARYYGKSRPTPDVSQENLEKYLTITQTVEDVVTFSKWIKSQYPNAKVVTFGMGLLGSRLVSASRNSTGAVDITVASSSPVELKYEVPEYADIAAEVLSRDHKQCFDAIHDALQCFERIRKQDTCQGHTLTDLKDSFGLCENIDPQNELDDANLLGMILRTLAGIVLTNNPDPNAPYNVQKMCQDLANVTNGQTHVVRVGNEIKRITKFYRLPCQEVRFAQTVKLLSSTAWDTPGTLTGERQALWLRCSQAAFIRTPKAFSLDDQGEFALKLITNLCKSVFNIDEEQMKQNTQMSNEMLGSRRLPSKCTIFTSGTDDLFNPLAVKTQEEAGSCNRAFVIKGAAFAKDFTPIRPEGQSYPPDLRRVQLEIGKTLDSWLKSGDCCRKEPLVGEVPPAIQDIFYKK